MKYLKKKLEKEYPFIENAVKASFIKSTNPNTTAVLLTLNLQEQADNIYIPRHPSDTAVNKYQYGPMMCHSCHKYGHTKT